MSSYGSDGRRVISRVRKVDDLRGRVASDDSASHRAPNLVRYACNSRNSHRLKFPPFALLLRYCKEVAARLLPSTMNLFISVPQHPNCTNNITCLPVLLTTSEGRLVGPDRKVQGWWGKSVFGSSTSPASAATSKSTSAQHWVESPPSSARQASSPRSLRNSRDPSRSGRLSRGNVIEPSAPLVTMTTELNRWLRTLKLSKVFERHRKLS